MNSIKWIFFIILIIFNFSSAYAASEIWPNLTIHGTKNSFKYDINIEGRFDTRFDENYQALLHTGLGYEARIPLSFWLGYTLVSSRGSDFTGVDRRDRFWQQFVYNLNLSNPVYFRTRLEESSTKSESEIALRLRQKIKFNKHLIKNIYPEIYNEIFINLNNPDWINNSNTINQNRLFLGALIKHSKLMQYRLGIMDQYQVRNTGNQNNIIYYMELFFNVSS